MLTDLRYSKHCHTTFVVTSNLPLHRELVDVSPGAGFPRAAAKVSRPMEGLAAGEEVRNAAHCLLCLLPLVQMPLAVVPGTTQYVIDLMKIILKPQRLQARPTMPVRQIAFSHPSIWGLSQVTSRKRVLLPLRIKPIDQWSYRRKSRLSGLFRCLSREDGRQLVGVTVLAPV